MPDFARRDRSTIAARFEPEEKAVLRRLIGEMRALLRERPDDDAVLDRLFPAAYEEPDDQSAYAELVGDELTRSKLGALDRLDDALAAAEDEMALSVEDADAWLTALNDMRLALGTRLEVDEAKMGAPFDDSDPDAQALAVLHWLGWIQESMLELREQPG